MAEGEEKLERGFTVTDRRRAARGFAEREEAGRPGAAEPHAPKEGERIRAAGAERRDPAGKASLGLLLSMLQGNVLHALGVLPDPRGQRGPKDPERARLFIDLIDLLREKTRGNLTPEEEVLLEEVLNGLRLLYVREAG